MKTDFSGEYELDRAASTLSAGAAGVDSAVLRIDHHDPVFRCWAKWVAGGTTLMEYAFELLADAAPGESDSSRLYWQGEALMAEHRTGTPDDVVTMSWRHELTDGGRRLRATEQLRGGGRDQDNVWEFVRRESGIAI